MDDARDISKILRYWLVLEALTPQLADKARSSGKTGGFIYEINKEQGPMPWMDGHEHSRKKPAGNRQWYYIVQAGLYDIETLYEKVVEKIKPLIPDYDFAGDVYDRVSGVGRLYDVEVDAEGRPIAETFALSMAGWAVGAILHHRAEALSDVLRAGSWSNLRGLPQPGSEEIQLQSGMPGFDALEVAFRKELAERVRLLEEPANKAWFDSFTRLVIRHCGLSEVFLNPTSQSSPYSTTKPTSNPASEPILRYIVKSRQRIASSDDEVNRAARLRPADESLINSFYIADLQRIESSKDPVGEAFLRYVKNEKEINMNKRRIDLQTKEGKMEVVRLLLPEYYPQGSWPSAYPLVRSQQFAVNALWQQLASNNKENKNGNQEGLFSINGPPGTGKTTLLREIVAAVVVERAKILSKYGDKIFLPKEKYNENELPYYPISHLDHAVVVASSNNGAVENVTLELPKADALASEFVNRVAYFQELADNLLRLAEKDSSKTKAWGLIAARLGKKENRDQFIHIVLENRPAARDSQDSSDDQDSQKSSDSVGLIHRLKEILVGNRSPKRSWQEAVEAFEEALKQERAHRSRIEREAKILKHFLDDRQSIRDQMRKIQEIKERMSRLEQEIDYLKNRRALLEVDIQRRREAWHLHKKRKPGWLETLRTFGDSYRRWRHELKELEREYREHLHLEEKFIADLREKEITWKEEQTKLEQTKRECRKTIIQMKNDRQKIKTKNKTEDHKSRFPLYDGSIDAGKAELQAPWADEAWRKARIEVFLRALELHQAFIENKATDQIRLNLILVKRWLSGKTLPADALKTALETLGLVVPVVSTTFASFPRMFREFGPRSIGWLLIDEAGQASPQEAAGAIWRAKRVVVVGDPLQLEPVVTLPQRIVAAFGKAFGVEVDFWPTYASVQSLADRTMIFGTKLKQFDGREVWVGAPLRVHRRCDNPMFSISNRLSYNNMMVWGRKPSMIQLPESGWIDVPFSGQMTSDHFIPEEGEALRTLLSVLSKCYQSFNPKDVYIISPFRDVVHQIKKKRLAANFRVPEERVGTVHTTQGKEAAIVILVLGGDPRKPGARGWAAEKPNLLNVAVSRAKERFYVIGDRSDWKNRGGFSIAAEMLKPLKLEGVDCGRTSHIN